MISQIEVTAEITLSDYIAYVALGQSTINFFMCCIACQCFRKLLQRHFEKLPERQIPPQTMAVTTRQHKICKRCDKPKPISPERQNQSDHRSHNRRERRS